jgi:hypothetical protein
MASNNLSEIIQAIAKIAALEVGDDLKLHLISAALDYAPPTPRKRRRRKRRAEVVKLVPHSDPPRAS